MATRPILTAVDDDDAGMSLATVAVTLDIDAVVAGEATPSFALGELYPVVFDLRSGHAEALRLQARARAAGADVLFIGIAPDTVQFGPFVSSTGQGCLACRNTRALTNDPRPRPVGAMRPAPAALRPLGPAAMAMLSILAQHYAGPQAAAGLRNSVVVWHRHGLDVTTHRFLPVPGCGACGEARTDTGPLVFGSRLKAVATDKRAANPALTLAALRDAFVDRHCGLIKHVFQDTASSLMPLCSAEMQLGDGDFEAGYGRADTAAQSELIAILEAVERYAGHRRQAGGPTLRASFAALAGGPLAAVDPTTFILHHPAQASEAGYDLVPYSPDLDYNWIQARSLDDGSAVLVPEQFGFYRLPADPDVPLNRFVYDSSSGCSLGGSPEEAALGGLYELVERDAYFATWYGRIAPRRILTDSVTEPRSAALIARAEAEGYEVCLFDITTDIGIPAVWGMVVDPSDTAPVKSYCASACHGRWSEAIFSALVEVTTSIGVYRKSMAERRGRARELFADAASVQAMEDHVLLYSLPESYARLGFLHGGPEVTLADCEAELPSLVERDLGVELRRQVDKVRGVASDVIVVDQTIAAMAPLNLSCVKVLAPGLLPVTFGHQYRRIGLERINQVAQFRRPGRARLTAATINPQPHNFP